MNVVARAAQMSRRDVDSITDQCVVSRLTSCNHSVSSCLLLFPPLSLYSLCLSLSLSLAPFSSPAPLPLGHSSCSVHLPSARLHDAICPARHCQSFSLSLSLSPSGTPSNKRLHTCQVEGGGGEGHARGHANTRVAARSPDTCRRERESALP